MQRNEGINNNLQMNHVVFLLTWILELGYVDNFQPMHLCIFPKQWGRDW